jgi:hypothetical protein
LSQRRPAPQLVDSLPDQRIDALPGATRQEAYWKIEALCELRRRSVYPEREIAQRAGFGSTEAMYHQLKIWGLTGLLPPEKQEETRKPKVEKPDRKVHISGDFKPGSPFRFKALQMVEGPIQPSFVVERHANGSMPKDGAASYVSL